MAEQSKAKQSKSRQRVWLYQNLDLENINNSKQIHHISGSQEMYKPHTETDKTLCQMHFFFIFDSFSFLFLCGMKECSNKIASDGIIGPHLSYPLR